MDLLAAMRMYVRVVERGSFSDAARDLALTQSSVSDRIKLLEKHLGVQLLLRSTRKQTCTEEGRIFYERSRQTMEASEAACAAIASQESVQGTLRMTAPQALGDMVIPAALKALRVRHPELRIHLTLDDDPADPVAEGAEVSLRLGPPGPGDFSAHRLADLKRSLVATPSYLAAHAPITKPEDLANHNFIGQPGGFGLAGLPLLDARQSMVHAPVQDAVVINHWHPVLQLLLCDAGIGVLPEIVVADRLKEGQLTRLLSDFTVPALECHALVASHPASPRAHAMLGMLKQGSACAARNPHPHIQRRSAA